MEPRTYPRKRRIWPWVAIAFVTAALCLGGVSLLTLASAAKDVTAPLVATPRQSVGSKPASAKPKAPSNAIGAGGWRVGRDVAAGAYRTTGAEDDGAMTLCYWEVRTDGKPDGAIGAQGASNKIAEPGNVDLKKGQYFKTSGCKPWTKQ
jgi:hypothetical protein